MSITQEAPRGRLIALCGLKTAGKSVVAEQLTANLPAGRVRFSGPLKDMLRVLGLNDAEIEGHLKEESSDKLCGQTPRHAMVTLGTEWGREMIGEDIWVRAWENSVKAHLANGVDIITEDLRFENEYEAVRRLGGMVIRIERPGLVASDHPSEQFAQSMIADTVVHNDGDLKTLQTYSRTRLIAEIGGFFSLGPLA